MTAQDRIKIVLAENGALCEEIGESFPRLLDAIHKYAKDKMLDLDISEIEWYHRGILSVIA